MTKRIILILLILVTVCGGFYYIKYMDNDIKVFEPISTLEIPFSPSSKIDFFADGFAVTNESTEFFYDDGTPIDDIFEENVKDLLDGTVKITKATANYALINDKFLFETTHIPFILISEAPHDSGWDIKEYNDCIILISKSNRNLLEPYIILKSDNSLHRVEGLSDLSYIDSDFNNQANALSVLAVNKENPFPSTKVFHYNNITKPYSVLSIDDELYYKIYRKKDFVLLIGLHQIKCYDIEGNLKWLQKIPNSYIHQSLHINNNLAIYFNNANINGHDNTLIVDQDGNYKYTYLPRGLRHIKPYKNGYIGILDKKTVVFLDSKGVIVEKFSNATNVNNIFWSTTNEDNIYVYTDNSIKIYSLLQKKKEIEKEKEGEIESNEYN